MKATHYNYGVVKVIKKQMRDFRLDHYQKRLKDELEKASNDKAISFLRKENYIVQQEQRAAILN